MNFFAGSIVVLFFGNVCFAAQLTDVVTLRDKGNFKTLFESVPYSDVTQAYYAVKGMKALGRGAPLPAAVAQAACNSAKTADVKNFEHLFHAAEIINEVSSCKHKLHASSVEEAHAKLVDTADANTLYRSVCISKAGGKKLEAENVMKTLATSVQKVDNSVLAASYALLAALRLDGVKDYSGLTQHADVEDMAAQSDEVDGSYSHFESDLTTTATFITAAFEASSKIKSVKEIDAEQAILFINFILRHKSAGGLDKAYYIITSLSSALKSQTKYLKAQILSGTSVSKDNQEVIISITDALSTPSDSVTVKVESVSRSSDSETLISNLPLKRDAKSGNYKIKMWDAKPKSGFYDITVSVQGTSGAVAGVDDLEFKVKVTTIVKVVDAKVASLERDASITPANLKAINFPQKSSDIAGDAQQKLVMTFKVQDTMDNRFVKPHQVFVRFVHKASDEEVIFIAEADSSSMYKFEVDLNVASKEQFNSKSGLYTMELIIGDASTNPIIWNVADVKMRFDESAQKPKMPSMYVKKDEIKHTFRTQEARPPALVSTAFTAACLFPFLVLFVLWGKVGANVSNLSFAPSNIVFHAGFASIFVLYYYFWVRINMFMTVQYLLGIGLITFVAGNKVLSKIAAQRG